MLRPFALLCGCALLAASLNAQDIETQLAYGPATTMSFFDQPQLHDTKIDAQGIVRADTVADHEIRLGFALSYLFSKEEKTFGIGPMLVTDIEIGTDKPATVGSLGVGIMFAFRDLNIENPGRLNGFGIGIAYMVSTGVQTLRSDFMPDMPAPETELRFVDKTRGSLALVATWSFGKATQSAETTATTLKVERESDLLDAAQRRLSRVPSVEP